MKELLYFIPAVGLFIADGSFVKRGWIGYSFIIYQVVTIVYIEMCVIHKL